MIRLPGHFVTMLLNVKSSLCSFRIQYTCPFIFNDKHRLYFTSITCMYLIIQMKYSYCMTETLLCSNVHHSRIIFTVPKLQVMKASVYGYAICIILINVLFICASDNMAPQSVNQLLLIFCYLLFIVFWAIWPVNLFSCSRYFPTFHIKRGHKLSYNLTANIILYCLYVYTMFSRISLLTNDLGYRVCWISPSHLCNYIPSFCMSLYYSLVVLNLNGNPLIAVCTLVSHYVDNLASKSTCTKTCVGVESRHADDIYHKTILQLYVFNVCWYTCRPTFIYSMEFIGVNEFTNSHECIHVLVLLLFYYVVYIYNGG